MKKPSIFLCLLPLLLIGCSNGTPETSNSNTSSEEITQSEVKTSSQEQTSKESETNTNNSTASQENNTETNSETETLPPVVEKVVTTIPQVKKEGANYNEKVNDTGIYISKVKAELKNLQLIAAQDMISGNQSYVKDGVNYNYKLMMSDGENIIFIACDYAAYDMPSEYENDHQKYDVTGYVGYFNNQIEVFSEGKQVKYLANKPSEDFDFISLSEEVSIANYYEQGEKAILNDKGVAYVDKLYSLRGLCLANNYNNNNVIFGNGDYIVEIHSNRYITNKFSVGKSYIITGFISSYKYKLGMELADYQLIDEEIDGPITFNKDEAQVMKASDLYKCTYKSDSKQAHPTNLTYTRLFYKPLKVIGYFDLSEKGGRYTGMIGDTIIPGDTYIKQTSIKTYKYLSLTNENYVDMRDDDPRANTPLLDLMMSEVEFNILPNVWDTKGFPKVYVYDYTPLEIIE